MAATAETTRTDYRAESRSAPYVFGGAGTEAIAGAGAVVLTILALIGMAPTALTAVAAIAIGGGLLIEAFAVAAKWQSLRVATDTNTLNQEVEMGGGLTAEMIGGVGGVTLGILALLGVLPEILLGVSAIAFGGALLFGSGTEARLASVGRGSSVPDTVVQTGAGGEVLVGLAGVTLGILALALGTMTLTTIGLLTVGAGMVLGGGALMARVGSIMR